MKNVKNALLLTGLLLIGTACSDSLVEEFDSEIKIKAEQSEVNNLNPGNPENSEE